MSAKSKNVSKIVSLADARHKKLLDEKEEKLAKMAERFEKALPNKATPVKDYLKSKKSKKNKRK